MSTTPSEPARAARVVPAPTLRFTSGPAAGTALRLDDDELTIGRREGNDLVIADPAVSRAHLRVAKAPNGTVTIVDLGSSGGTTLNDDPITGVQVAIHGDRIRIGDSECVLEHPVAAAADVGSEGETLEMAVPEVTTGPGLSPRQEQVLQLIAEGMTNSQIGEVLGITERTVKAYAQELYVKLGVGNRAGAVAEAHREGLL